MRKVLLLTTALFIGVLSSCNSQNSVLVNGEKMNLKDGIYANIHTTKGDILLSLHYEKTPMTVANFVGLAEGKIKNNAKAEGVPYFDGLKFHRVIANFMIQGGDPLGTGAGDPGYKFPDEFDASLKHDSAGVLSMANAGPGTNGSQFFITHVPTPHLDGKHTVFGKVINGQNVVDKVAKDDVMTKVEILRVGEKAKAFDPVVEFEEGKKSAGAKAEAAKREAMAKAAKEAEESRKAVEGLIEGAQSTPSGLYYKVIEEGKGPKPTVGQTVNIAYAGYLANGKLFDSSIEEIAKKHGIYNKQRKYEPYGVVYGPAGRVIEGWKEGLTLMNVGDKFQLIIPPNLGYGSRGMGNGLIPANSWLIFDVEMVSIK